jgi:hypothetical protein
MKFKEKEKKTLKSNKEAMFMLKKMRISLKYDVAVPFAFPLKHQSSSDVEVDVLTDG